MYECVAREWNCCVFFIFNIVPRCFKFSMYANFFLLPQYGDIALHTAAELGHSEIVSVLLKQGADPKRENKVIILQICRIIWSNS